MANRAAVRRGSSPHTRGARGEDSSMCRRAGIIPAYAGSTSAPASGWGSGADHPRIRGEHVKMAPELRTSLGSSPHTRGAPVCVAIVGREMGIIPAYAGSTWTRSRSGSASGDHPRIRGEHVQMNRAIADGSGSSPHTRGAHPIFDEVYRKQRIIPAYAGSTAALASQAHSIADHPRIRGEHFGHVVYTVGISGSSPHTRGAPRQRRLDHQPIWIIPAYAGSTTSGATKGRRWRDHPRIRGEHHALSPPRR